MGKGKICVLGAGLAGLSAAWHLSTNGIDNEVFEKETTPGGLCRSKTIGHFTFDCDGHLLNFRREGTRQFITERLGVELDRHTRSAWIHSHGRYIRYPFQANLSELPRRITRECVEGFINASERSRRDRRESANFEAWIIDTFGSGIAKYFMVPYNTKFWTVPLRKMCCGWLDGFIPVPSAKEVLRGAHSRNRKQFGYNAVFWYPRRGGISAVPEALARRLNGLHAGKEVLAINPRRKEIVFSDSATVRYSSAVFTLPLPEIVRLIKELPSSIRRAAEKLRWNSIINVNIGMDRMCWPGMHWVYFPGSETSFFRAGCYHNFSASLAPEGSSSIYLEISYSRAKPLNVRGAYRRALKDLE
ncbi:MAG TPA: FAD-dependent oxidoreductase, partial [Candidatus Omnitrophota bacterium]|nr:FAD-dependent oxidoreductase [Candidatus Omnitrophota bacterium]